MLHKSIFWSVYSNLSFCLGRIKNRHSGCCACCQFCVCQPGFRAVMVEDMMNSPTDRLLPHFSSYSRETGFSFTETSVKPADRISRSNSSTEEAPLTQQECILGSFCSASGICFMITMSQMEIRPPGFRTRNISR